MIIKTDHRYYKSRTCIEITNKGSFYIHLITFHESNYVIKTVIVIAKVVLA